MILVGHFKAEGVERWEGNWRKGRVGPHQIWTQMDFCAFWLVILRLQLLQVPDHERHLWTSLSPHLRRRVSELSQVTNVLHVARLIGVLQFFDSLDLAQFIHALRCTSADTIRHLVGNACSMRVQTMTMMQTLIWFLVQCYYGNNQYL